MLKKITLVCFAMLSVSIQIYCSSNAHHVQSSYQTPTRKHKRRTRKTESDTIVFASLVQAQIIDIDELIRDDLLIKYNNVEKIYKVPEKIPATSDLRKHNLIKKLERACENYKWYQAQQRLAGRAMLPIALYNSVIDEETGETMLHELSKCGATHTVSFLLENNTQANLNALTSKGFVPLHYAIAGKHALTVRFLLEYYTDSMVLSKNAEVINSRTFFWQAINTKDEEMIEIFIDHKFKPRKNEPLTLVRTKQNHNQGLFHSCKRIHVGNEDEPIALSGCIIEPIIYKKQACAINNKKFITDQLRSLRNQKQIHEKRIMQSLLDSDVEMVLQSKK